VIALLARWVTELRVDVTDAHAENERLAARITVLEHKLSAFGWWMRTGRTPSVLRDLAGQVT